ncbi:hypothetical protein [Providencia sp. PROV255]|uniref:hypothetical protein n=1 Tax=Providencia sp. PROV255 TaxID=2949943 RepID=UPI00234BD837|nr:hypothetical protein [Providencia sp. PROV255]
MNLSVDVNGSIHEKHGGYDIFRQLAVKIKADEIDDASYFNWLDRIPEELAEKFPSIEFKEKNGVREFPPLNTAVYYDTDSLDILPTGALLRTSCSKLTHAFCAFKMPEDSTGNRLDRRHVFEGRNKGIIQSSPYGDEAIAIVKNLITRKDIEQPGTFLKSVTGVNPEDLAPVMILRGYRSTFYVLIDGLDALRCSMDRSFVFDARNGARPETTEGWKGFREIEISLYPKISDSLKGDPRVIEVVTALRDSLVSKFGAEVIHDIKYQRGMKLILCC